MLHPNEEVARQEMEAALRGDLEGMIAHYTDDVVLHYPGRNKLSGTYRGINAIRAWVDMVSELIGPGGSFTRSLHDILANDDHTVQLVSVDARTASGRTASWNAAVVMHIRAGKICEMWIHIDDPYVLDALLG